MRITSRQVGLAAVILLAPGGFLLGATLVARHWRRQKGATPPESPIVP